MRTLIGIVAVAFIVPGACSDDSICPPGTVAEGGNCRLPESAQEWKYELPVPSDESDLVVEPDGLSDDWQEDGIGSDVALFEAMDGLDAQVEDPSLNDSGPDMASDSSADVPETSVEEVLLDAGDDAPNS